MGFLTWLQDTDFAQFLASDPYAYPILLCFHAIGMAIVVGLMWVLSLRVIGYPQVLPIGIFHTLSNLALWGFAINAVSGFLIFSTEAMRVIDNAEFLIKMACILLGGLSAWYMMRIASQLEPDARFPLSAKLVAAATSLMWLLAIIFGRQVAYTIKPPF